MDIAAIVARFDLHTMALRMNAGDFTHADSLFTPEIGGNCVNWLLGHLLVSRDDLMMRMEYSTSLPDGFRAIYAQGSDGRRTDHFLPYEDLVQLWGTLHTSLIERFKRVDITNHDTLPAFEKFDLMQFHEAYHIGQMGLLRRLMGKEGQIK